VTTAWRAEAEARAQKIEAARARMAANRATPADQPESAPWDPVRPQPAEESTGAERRRPQPATDEQIVERLLTFFATCHEGETIGMPVLRHVALVGPLQRSTPLGSRAQKGPGFYVPTGSPTFGYTSEDGRIRMLIYNMDCRFYQGSWVGGKLQPRPAPESEQQEQHRKSDAAWEREIIEAGTKALARKYHPDAPGGSHEQFVEMKRVSDRLLEWFT